MTRNALQMKMVNHLCKPVVKKEQKDPAIRRGAAPANLVEDALNAVMSYWRSLALASAIS